MKRLLAIEMSSLDMYLSAIGEAPNGSDKRNAGPAAASAARKSGDVVVFPIHGVMMGRTRVGWYSTILGCDAYAESINAAVNNPEVKAIILDINSPGGEVAGTPELAEVIASGKEKKPIIASVAPLCASAAYWIASQCTEICVTPSGEVGSIGVLMGHFSYQGYLDKEGMKFTLIASGKYKGEGNPYQDLGDETVSRFQEDCDTIYSEFVNAVAKGRGVSASDVKSGFGEGGTVLAREAKKLGMIDRVETLSETLARLGVASTKANRGKSLLSARHELLTLD